MSDKNALLTRIDKGLGHLAGLFAIVGGIGIVVLLGVTVVAVFWRYALNAPIFGIEDVSIVTLTILAAGAISFGGRHGAHVSINLIDRFAGDSLNRWIDAVMYFLTAGMSYLAVYALITRACGMEKACITSNLAIEHRPFFWVLAAAFLFYGLHLTLRFIEAVTGHNQDEGQN